MQRRTRRQVLAALTGVSAGVAGCSDDAGRATVTATQARISADARYGYTYGQPSGNRVLSGSGRLHDTEPVEIETAEPPSWLVALPAGPGSYWTVVSGTGRATTYRVADGTAATVTEYRPLPAGTPPVARLSGSGVGLVRPPGDAAGGTHPVVTEAGLLYIAENGELVLSERGTPARWQVDGLPDGRIVHTGGSRYALLGDTTTRYGHAALGDRREGGSLVLFDASEPAVTARAGVGPPDVIEGLGALAADLDGDGRTEIVVTVANGSDGARVAVYDEAGRARARGPVYGPGWRHQLAVADFGAGRELAVTRKPHVDYTVEFYRLAGDSLSITAEHPNVSTHTYGSSNTDGAIGGDVDGDGTAELLVPTADRTSLRAIERTAGGARTDWQLDPGSSITSNLTGVSLSEGGVAVGVGTDDGLRVWQG